ncbi:hypothetical protein P7K49_018431, partial [Saguinus oedipus]
DMETVGAATIAALLAGQVLSCRDPCVRQQRFATKCTQDAAAASQGLLLGDGECREILRHDVLFSCRRNARQSLSTGLNSPEAIAMEVAATQREREPLGAASFLEVFSLHTRLLFFLGPSRERQSVATQSREDGSEAPREPAQMAEESEQHHQNGTSFA